MTYKALAAASLLALAMAAGPLLAQTPPSQTQAAESQTKFRRFFSEDSFWNQKIPANAKTHKKSDYWIGLLEQDPSCFNFGINIDKFTIPVFEVDSSTPRQIVKPLAGMADAADGRPEGEAVHYIYQHPNVAGKPIPIPESLAPSPGTDAHIAIVDYEAGDMWDAWFMKRLPDGTWASNTLMHTDLNGTGVYRRDEVFAKIGGKERYVGPGRAAGVPVAAGLIMYEEVRQGSIDHKIAAAVRYVAHGERIFPPAWSADGAFEGGIPEGATLQLDPTLDLAQFNLTPEELLVAKAMQEYGMVLVDYAGANVLYAEGLWYDPTRSWDGKLRKWNEEGGIKDIPLKHYRVLDMGKTYKVKHGKPQHHLDGLAEPRNCR